MVWALLSAVIGWLYNFSYKVIAQREYDTNLSATYSYITATILAWIYCMYKEAFLVSYDVFFITLILSFINISFFYISVISRVESMKNIDTVIFYPLYKTFWPLMVTAISLLYFGEYLSFKESMGIIIGITIPLMLITKAEDRIQKNLKLWVLLVLLTAVVTSVSSVATKMVYIKWWSPEIFLFISLFLGTIYSMIAYQIHWKNRKNKFKTEWILKFSIIAWIIHVFAFLTFIKAMIGNMAIVFTINSFSILVPIILSIIFYGEHFNLKKGIVIALSIVSILLFI
jgi:uncharacterized membrane protein